MIAVNTQSCCPAQLMTEPPSCSISVVRRDRERHSQRKTPRQVSLPFAEDTVFISRPTLSQLDSPSTCVSSALESSGRTSPRQAT